LPLSNLTSGSFPLRSVAISPPILEVGGSMRRVGLKKKIKKIQDTKKLVFQTPYTTFRSFPRFSSPAFCHSSSLDIIVMFLSVQVVQSQEIQVIPAKSQDDMLRVLQECWRSAQRWLTSISSVMGSAIPGQRVL